MIRIITDSAADFTSGELKTYHITAVPIQVTFGDASYEDGVTLTPDIFWPRIMSGENPKTSQPSPDAFLTLFEEAKAAGDDVVCILLSSGLSGTVQSATLAKDMCDYDGIHIVDSLQAATAEKLLVLRACQLRDEGSMTAGEMADELRLFTKRIKLYASIDTLEYLARGGRIPAAAAALGTLVQLKIILTIKEDGTLGVAGKGMGLHRTMAALIKLIGQHKISSCIEPRLLFTYSPDNCFTLQKKLLAAGISCSDEHASALGSTISTHIGPGAYGLAFVEEA